VAQHLEDQALAQRLDGDDVAVAAQDELADADLAGVLQRLLDDDVAFVGKLAVGQEVIGRLVIAVVDRILVDEANELDGLLRLELQIVDLLGIDQDIFALLVFVALDDLLVLDGADARRDLLVADALTGRLVDLVQLDALLRAGCWVELDRDVDERKPQMAGPECAGCHTRYS
jgi:hypothetical protein